MHLLEDHTVAWVQKWHEGFGLLGEQGAESIHAKFNALHRTYASIHEKLQHYQCVMKEHLISIAPQNVAALPVNILYKNIIWDSIRENGTTHIL